MSERTQGGYDQGRNPRPDRGPASRGVPGRHDAERPARRRPTSPDAASRRGERPRRDGSARSGTNAARPSVRRSSGDGRSQRAASSRAGRHASAPKPSGVLPTLWTKSDRRRPTSERSDAAGRVFGLLGALLRVIGRALGAVGSLFLTLLKRFRIARIVTAVVLVVAIVFGVDAALTGGRVYAGVKVGEVDLSGMTVAEAQQALESTYGERLASTSVTVYASEEARQAAESGEGSEQSDSLREQQSVEEARASTTSWSTNAQSLQAVYDAAGAAQAAYEVGREDGGFLARAGAQLFGRTFEAHATYVHDSIETLLTEVDAAIGEARVDWSVTVDGGVASTTEGHDGWMVNRDSFQLLLDEAFLSSGESYATIVASAEYAPMRVDQAEAEATANAINAALSAGAQLSYEGATWDVDATTLGNWIETTVVDANGGQTLVAYLDEDTAKSAIVTHFREETGADVVKVTFERAEDDTVWAHFDSDGQMPDAAVAVAAINESFFGGSEPSHAEVSVGSMDIPDTLTLDEALDNGLVTRISRYTTEYTSGVEARNHNIHLAADLLDGSIATANGGTWSFNATAGNCDEAAGFQAAGSIVAGEYTDEIGGGICQVATTVFNAVYNAGLPITHRYNHSLYIASYPAGRDAAVSWPDLDLEWRNDTTSDVILVMDYTDSSVTANLYGVDPGYSVSTEVGQWEEGTKYSTVTEVDDSLAPGASYIKTAGTDGKKITIVRYVYNASGNLLREDVFESNYDPVDEVKVVGPDAGSSDGASR